MKRCGILVAAPELDEIPHPSRPMSGHMAVVRKTTRGRFAVAGDEDEYFDPIPVSEDDVRAYSISVPNLVRLIRQHNDITGECEAGDQGIAPVGQKQLDGYGTVAAFLSLANYSPSQFSVRCLALRKPDGVKRMVVLVPSPMALSGEEHELLNARGITLVALAPLADEGKLAVDWKSAVLETSERTVSAAEQNLFRLDGEFWTVTFAGKTIRLKDRLGLQYIAHLISKKNCDIHAAMLVAVSSGTPMIKPLAGTEVADQLTIDECRARYDDLHFQLEEAERNNDAARQEKIQHEIDDLTRQLTSATGLGRRKRKMGDDAEKARKSVTNAIARTITQIKKKKHPELARHLQNSIRTGQYLSYSPETLVDWVM